MKILHIQALRGPNIWSVSRKKLIQMRLDLEELEELPGVGHMTASVVVAQAFGIPAFPVDTHIHRCAKRWGLSEGRNVVQTERDLKKCFPRKLWIKVHLQIIYFARKFCPALRHHVDKCPICSLLHKGEKALPRD